jgi:K+-transporting ATPase ATPase A chain
MFAWAELVAFLILLTALTPVLGGYVARVFEGPPTGIRRLGERFERLVFRTCKIDPNREMSPKAYLLAVIIFSGVSAAKRGYRSIPSISPISRPC